jgi:multidrug efflux pump subunit AcrB
VDLGTAVGRVRTAVTGVALPPGVTVVIAGQSQTQAESFRNLAEVLGLAVLLVFVVMLFQFRTFRAPLVILMLMPLAVVGAVVGLFLTKTPLNVSSFMGAIMLAGVVVKNGILLLDRAQHDLLSGRPVVESMVEAGRARLRPILMTTLTAVLGLIPLALGIGAGAEMQKPLAIAVVSGLMFSTLLTLFLGPVLYATVMEFGNGRRVETVSEG